MRTLRVLVAVLMASFSLLMGAAGASADEGEGGDDGGGFICSGGSLTSTPPSPSIIPPGTYRSIRVTGVCLAPGQVDVQKSVTVEAGAVLFASLLNVGRNVKVERGATLFMGCSPDFGCSSNTVDQIGGNLSADGALGVVVHAVSVAGNYSLRGGGGKAYDGTPQGVFAAFHSPVFSVLDGGSVGGDVSFTGYQAFWLGLVRTQVGGDVRVNNNALGDPDAIEILSNTINGDLSCRGNKFVDTSTTPPTFTLKAPFNSTEAPNGDLFPRTPEPNTVNGRRFGQCVNANPPPGLF